VRIVRRIALWLAVLVAASAALAAVAALAGALYAHFRGGTTYAHAIGWAMLIAGGLVALLVGQSGSPIRMAGEARIVVGGRFVQGSDIPLPQTPFVFALAGLLVAGLGIWLSLL